MIINRMGLTERVHEDAKETKAKLIALALSGAKRPKSWESLGVKLQSYMSKSQSEYDENFRNEIIKANPKWFPRLK